MKQVAALTLFLALTACVLWVDVGAIGPMNSEIGLSTINKATFERLFAGFANGELWESRDRGDTWTLCPLGQPLPRLLALVSP